MSEDRYRSERPTYQVYCGNFEYDATVREIERLFDRYGPVERVDMKTGFAFVYMRDRRDAEDAIKGLDRREFGYRRRRLRVEWAKTNDGEVKRREETRRRQTKPTSTLFVVNFDVERTRERDIERHFEEYGRLTRVQIKRNYAFVQYETVDQATEAIRALHNSKFGSRTISVEYVAREADGRRIDEDGFGGGGGFGGGAGRSRSRSPVGRRRSRSPSYGRGSRSPPPRGSPSPRPLSRSPPPRSRSPRDRSRSRSPYRSASPRNGRSPTHSRTP